MKLRHAVSVLAALVISAAAALAAFTSPDGWSADEIARLSVQLNESAAIGVPHDFLMGDQMREANRALIDKVESGAELTAEESGEYRRLFQAILHDNQRFLGVFDRELTVLADHAPGHANNEGGHGIAGKHDHHDLSARLNFAGLLASLRRLEAASGSFAVISRISSANSALKDLADLIGHLGIAPHTVSVGYEPPDSPWPDAELGAQFEAMLAACKEAQLQPVNSPANWADADRGIAAYAALILAVQTRIAARTSPLERRIAGRFLSVQTLAPQVDLARPLRPRPHFHPSG